MKCASWLVAVIACALALPACSTELQSPATPSNVASPERLDANADGSTLKATAPTPNSPINTAGVTPGEPVVLVVGNSTTTYAAGISLSYRFEVTNAAGALVESGLVASGSSTTSRTVAAELEGDQTYQWRARAEYQGTVGPWSTRVSFVAPATNGYIRGNELYDPLINGKTVGVAHDAAFVPGVGIRLNSNSSYVSYELQQPLTGGEYSVLVTNLAGPTAGLKTKVMSMSSGYDDITTNSRRFTIEKRGTTEPGAVAWRVIASGGAIETVGDERLVVNFQPASTYLWQATWGNSNFGLTITEGGVGGRRVYDQGRPYIGVYDANPHIVYLGAPETRSGPDSQSVPGIVLRQVWVSRNPRPAFADK